MEEDYCLLGIVSDEPDYKMCWLLNQVLHTGFTREEDLVLFNKKLGEEQEISLFTHEDEQRMATYRIIVNRANNGHYLAELKQIDFFLHIQGEIDTEHIRQLIGTIGRMSAVRMCVPVDLSLVKDRQRLQLW